MGKHTCHPEMSRRRYEKRNSEEGRLPRSQFQEVHFHYTLLYIKTVPPKYTPSLLTGELQIKRTKTWIPWQSTEWPSPNDYTRLMPERDLDKQAPPTMWRGMDTANRHQQNRTESPDNRATALLVGKGKKPQCVKTHAPHP